MLKNLVNLSILTTIVVAVWLLVSIFQSSTSTTISPELANQIIPIAPNFNLESVRNIQDRTFIPTDLSEQLPIGSASATQVATPTVAPTLIPTSAPSALDEGLIQGSSGSGLISF